MQFAISDVATTVFAHEFYTATADGYALGAALTEARKAMFTQQLGVEWATPVLSTRTDATHLFDCPTSNPAAAAPTRAVNQQSQNAAPTLLCWHICTFQRLVDVALPRERALSSSCFNKRQVRCSRFCPEGRVADVLYLPS